MSYITSPVAIYFLRLLGKDDVIYEVIYEVIYGVIGRKFRAPGLDGALLRSENP